MFQRDNTDILCNEVIDYLNLLKSDQSKSTKFKTLKLEGFKLFYIIQHKFNQLECSKLFYII